MIPRHRRPAFSLPDMHQISAKYAEIMPVILRNGHIHRTNGGGCRRNLRATAAGHSTNRQHVQPRHGAQREARMYARDVRQPGELLAVHALEVGRIGDHDP